MGKASRTAFVITVSDRASSGERDDASGPGIAAPLPHTGSAMIKVSSLGEPTVATVTLRRVRIPAQRFDAERARASTRAKNASTLAVTSSRDF